MIKRIGYTLGMAWRHRKMLKPYRYEKALQSEGILNCDPNLLKTRGIKVIALDLDGVLTPYGEIEVSQEIDSWLNFCIGIFGEGNVFILTNKPTSERLNYFSKHFKGITLILPKRKKPYPDGIQQILQIAKVSPPELLMVDDRLLTGVLAAIVAGSSACYITKPLISLTKRPLPELFFIGLRKMERFFI